MGTFMIYYISIYYARICVPMYECILCIGTPKSILIEKIINRHKTRIIRTTVIMERH